MATPTRLCPRSSWARQGTTRRCLARWSAVSANVSDSVRVVGVQFKLDGANLGAEDAIAPYGVTFKLETVANGAHLLSAVWRDATGNQSTTIPVVVVVDNSNAAPKNLEDRRSNDQRRHSDGS